jgi:phosphate:Na+ symporter
MPVFLLFFARSAFASEVETLSLDTLKLMGGLLGGLSLFLYGIDLLAVNMRKTAGSRMRSFLRGMTATPLSGLLGGAALTILMQSSSATTALLASHAQAHLVTAAQSVGVIIGANIGTTFTTQLIAFDITEYALLLLATGYLIQAASENPSVRQAGLATAGVGLIFHAMALMSRAMAPLRHEPWFAEALLALEGPLPGVFAGALLTGIIQSSAAFLAIVMALAQAGMLSLESAAPLIIGANIGACVTVLIASLKTSREAKRVALVQVLFNMLGAVLFLAFLNGLLDMVRALPPYGVVKSALLPRQIANAHTLFNVLAASVFLPVASSLAALAEKLLPVTKKEFAEPGRPVYLDWDLMHTPTLAVERARLEMVVTGEVVSSMLEKTREAFTRSRAESALEAVALDDKADGLIETTNAYLSGVLRKQLLPVTVEEARLLLYILAEFGHMADLVETSLGRLVVRKIEEGVPMSAEGEEEIRRFFDALIAAHAATVAFLASPGKELLETSENAFRNLWTMDAQSREAHFERLRAGVTESAASRQLHMDMLDHLRALTFYAGSVLKHERRLPGINTKMRSNP